MTFENNRLGLTGGFTRVPLLIVTGFLGAGKTTLLKHLLTNKANLRIAVLVNELGSIDIDSSLLDSKKMNAGLGT